MRKFAQRLQASFPNLFSTRSRKLIISVVLLASLGLVLVQVQRMQNLVQNAEEPLTPPVQVPGSLRVNVLAIGFNPVEGTTNGAELYFLPEGTTADQVENQVFQQSAVKFREATGGIVDYQIVDTLHITSFPRYTNGQTFTLENYKECVSGRPEYNIQGCEAKKTAFDHTAWLTDNRICEIAKEKNIDEIWVLSLPYVMRYESFMFGPKDSFSVNAPQVSMPGCSKNYVLMNGTYQQPEQFLHVYGHRIEDFMRYLTASWKEQDRNKYWKAFSAIDRYATPSVPLSTPSCGNAHFPANAQREYDHENQMTQVFTCSDWKHFPNLTGETETISCEAWGCSDEGWQQYWFAALPRSEGEVQMVSSVGIPFSFKKNWWYYILYPENAIAQQKLQTTCTFTGTRSFKTLSGVFAKDKATFSFTYQGCPTSYTIDVSTKPDMSFDVYGNFAKGQSSPIVLANPRSVWDKYACGTKLYWKIYNEDRTVVSPIQATTIVCPVPPTPTPTISNKNFYPTDDATARSDKPSTNFGTSSVLSVDGNPKFIALLKFNLSSLAGKSLKSAHLRLWVNNSSPGSFGIFPTSSTSWTESAVSYANRPALGGRIASFSSPANGSWVSVDLTSFVKTKLGTKMGIAITTTSSDAASFNSQENAVNKPRLYVSYQ